MFERRFISFLSKLRFSEVVFWVPIERVVFNEMRMRML